MIVTSIQLVSQHGFIGGTDLGFVDDRVDVVHAELFTRDVLQSQKYHVKGITGLDPEDLFSLLGNTTVGHVMTSSYNIKPKDRTIVVLVKLNPQYDLSQTESSLRDQLYKMISYDLSGEIEMRFMSGSTKVASLNVRPTKFEAGLFASDSEIQITFIAAYPFLRGDLVTLTEGDGFDTAGPLGISSSIPYDEYYRTSFIDTLSTAPHGFESQWTFSADASEFDIQQFDDPYGYIFHIDYAFLNGDLLFLGSEYDNKYVYIDRSTVIINLADHIRPGSIWPVMFPSGSMLIYGPDFGLNIIKYQPAYWGV